MTTSITEAETLTGLTLTRNSELAWVLSHGEARTIEANTKASGHDCHVTQRVNGLASVVVTLNGVVWYVA